MARLKLYVGHIQRFSSGEIYHAGKSGKKVKDNDSEEDGWIQLQSNGHTILGNVKDQLGTDNSATKSIYLNQNLSWLKTDTNLMTHKIKPTSITDFFKLLFDSSFCFVVLNHN